MKVRKVEEVSELLKQAEEAYYNGDTPLMSDVEYDLMKRDYETLMGEIERVGSKVVGVKEVKHPEKMYSLDNVYDKGTLEEWCMKRMRESRDDLDIWVIEPKLDGLAVSVVYRYGVLISVGTRGDGNVGEDVTEVARWLLSEDIPSKLPEAVSMEVRGEVVMLRSDFETMNRIALKAGGKLLSNPRNAAAGTLRLQDMEALKTRRLRFYAYQVMMPVRSHLSHLAELSWLKTLGINTVTSLQGNHLTTVWEAVEQIAGWRIHGDIDLDGAVVKMNVYRDQQALGFTNKVPRWAIAYKYPPEEMTSTLKDVLWQVGRTGVITPVAVIDPVRVGGVMVSHVTLHNADVIRALDLAYGDRVWVRRAGDVIPQITRADHMQVESLQPVVYPTHCPGCQQPLIRVEGESAIRCVNASCPEIMLRKLIHFVARDAMDIEGLAEKTLTEAVEQGYIKTYADIYRLTLSDWASLPSLGLKRATKLYQAIQGKRRPTLVKLLYALGIDLIGKSTAFEISKQLRDIQGLLQITRFDELTSLLPHLGVAASLSLYEYFKNASNASLVRELLESMSLDGSDPIVYQNASTRVLEGLTFVITGRFELDRLQIVELIQSNGGQVTGSVSKRTSYLIAGEDAGSKYQKATQLGVPIIDLTQLNQLITSKHQ